MTEGNIVVAFTLNAKKKGKLPMGFTIELRSLEWEDRTFTSELIYEGRNARHAAVVILEYIPEPQDANVYKPFNTEDMDSIVGRLTLELGKTTPPISKGEADEYRELLKAIKDFRKKHQKDWDNMEFLYIFLY